MINNDDKVVINAIAVKEGLDNSDIASKTFTQNRYTITFDANNHGTAPDPIPNILKNETVTKPVDLTIDGFTFGGWYKEKECTTAWDFEKDLVIADITLYAKWTEWEKVADVTFSKTGAVDYEEKVTLNCGTAGTEICYSIDNGPYQPLSSPYEVTITKDSTIKAYATKAGMNNSKETTATYTIKTYTVTFNNGGHGITPKEISGLKRNDTLTAEHLKKIDDTNLGVKFLNWTDADSNVISASHVITKDLVLTAKWEDLVPEPIKGLTSVPSDKKIKLTWTEPLEADYKEVVITYDTNKTVKANKGTVTAIIPNRTNGQKYDFTVKVVDNANNESRVVNGSQYAMRDLTEKPRVLTNYTSPNPPISGSWTYVEFGDWPQTVKADEVKLSTETVVVNNWTCYYGSDGYYYVNVTASPNPSQYSLKTEFNSGSDYYFKLEPIQWRVLTNDYSGKKLLLAEKALAIHIYHEKSDTENINKYDTSEVRAYLNGTGTFNKAGFLQKAFTPTAIADISDTEVDNTAESTTDAGKNITQATGFVCGNTTDKIFLLSVKEVTTENYGFDVVNKYVGDSNNTKTSSRVRTPTDYAKATGIYIYQSGCSWWWLRSPHNHSSASACDVGEKGKADEFNFAYSTDGGIVPALSISF